MINLTKEQKEMIRDVIDNNPDMFWCRQMSRRITLSKVQKQHMYEQIILLLENPYNDEDMERVCGQPYNKEELIFLVIATELYYYSQFVIFNSPSPDHFMIATLTQAISNTIMAIRQLIESGYDYQVMVLMRNLYELYSTLIVTVVEPEKRLEYRTAENRDTARSVWYQHFRSEKFKRTLKKYLSKFPDKAEAILQMAEQQYDSLCACAHNDYMSILRYTFSKTENSEINTTNIWGRYADKKENLYMKLFFTAGIFNLLFFEILMDEAVNINVIKMHKREDGANNYDSNEWMLFVAIDSLHRLEVSLSKIMFTLCQQKG